MPYLKRSIWILFLIVIFASCSSDRTTKIEIPESYGLYANLLFPIPAPDRIILNLTEDPLHSIAVNWRTDTTVIQSFIQHANATHGPEFSLNVKEEEAITSFFAHKPEKDPEVHAHFHTATINGLVPGEKYVYRVGSEAGWSEWFQIRMPEVDEAISFVYFGDAQNDIKSMWSRVIRESYGTMPKADFMLHAGDLINRHDRDIEWGDWFYSGSFIHSLVPSMMTPGNHEYRNGELSPQWKPQFNLPANGPKGLEEVCYQVNYRQFKIISLDAILMARSKEWSKKQVEWLDSVLTNDPKKWVAITFHYPIFSTKPERDNKELRIALKPIFDKHKVDIVLQGHDHAYGRGMVNNVPTGFSLKDQSSGTMYVVSVSGPKMYDISDDPWMDRRAANTQLFQIITIDGDQLRYGAYTARGDLYDAFELHKTTDGPNKLINKIPPFPERLPE